MNRIMTGDNLPVLPSLDASPEKPAHYQYLKEFRVDPCPLFKQHQCTQHRPYTCFYWHFANQRRRRPVRRRDGTFNYSADIYCSKYDENSGVCPDGDDCPLLHRVAGDVERKYHIRYYKTALCVHASDARGHCSKNGAHCAFAHHHNDLRQPVFDIREVQGDFHITFDANNKERTSFIVEDPVWQNQIHVLSCYKTMQCRKPPRLCRQGYACPYYHNAKDRRRPPATFKYRSTPCAGAKNGDEWTDADGCESHDHCSLCHTRTEQQFHPEIYKSTKCNDILKHGYCPRGPFCAFAHTEDELNAERVPFKPPTPQPPREIEGCPMSTPSPTRHSLSQLVDIPECPLPPSGSVVGQQLRHQSECNSPNVTSSTGNLSSSVPTQQTFASILKQRSNTMSQCARPPMTLQPRFGGVSPPRTWTPIEPQHQHSQRIRTTSLNDQWNQDFIGSPSSLISRPRTGSIGNGAQLDNSQIESSSDEHLPPICERDEPMFLATDLLSAFGDQLSQFGSGTAPMRIPNDSIPHPDNDNDQFTSGSFDASSIHDMLESPLPNSNQQLQKELQRARQELAAYKNKMSIWEDGLRQARMACEAWKHEAECHRIRAQQLEMQCQRIKDDRDAALSTLGLLRAHMITQAPAQQRPIEPFLAVRTINNESLFSNYD